MTAKKPQNLPGDKSIGLGDRVRDMVSGIVGIVVARCFWLNGCVRTTLEREKTDKDGKPLDAYTTDEVQLALIKKRVVVPTGTTNGGPPIAPKGWPGPR